MDKRRRLKHQAHKEALVVARANRPYVEAIGGRNTVAALERAVRREAARFTDQESCRMQRRAAVARCRNARRLLLAAVRLITTVIRTVNGHPRVAADRITNDDQLIARVEALLAVAAPQAAALVRGGLQPTLLRRIADELAAFRMAKDAVTLAVAQFTEAAEAFDLAHEDARTAILILEGTLATASDAPLGALTSLRSAKRIYPRAHANAAAQPQPATLLPFATPPLGMTGTG